MSNSTEVEMDSLEEEVFKALDHQKRREILRFVGESRGVPFTKILNATKTQDSPTLSYHLRNLAPFLEQRDGKYLLSPIGKAAYTLLLKTDVYKGVARLQRRKTGAIIGSTFLWICAIAAALVLEADSFYSTIILPTLAGSCLMVIWELFE